MSLTAWIAALRDIAIVGALGFILWYVHRADTTAAKATDLAGVVKQLNANTALESSWAQESRNANAQRASDMQTVAAAIAAHDEPVWVRDAPSACPVSDHPAASAGLHPGAGGADAGPGGSPQPINIRPAITTLEGRYEQALTDCRSALAQWP